MSISPRFLDDIRGRLTLSEVIGKHVKVTRAGREHKACCPFHKEKTPSFTINDQKQFYHCFGCGAHGDVIGFRMQHDNLSFVEAIESLSAQAGLKMPTPDPAFVQKEQHDKGVYELVEEASKWFQTQLSETSHKDVLEYMVKRGIRHSSIESFRIGYAPPDGQALRSFLRERGFSDQQMIEAGILRASNKEKGEPYSFFRDRVIFPVADRRGRVVAFGGRVLPENMRPPQQGDFVPPKYINSSDTPLFHKGRMLFGESHARQATRDGHTPIVVEGYLDVIACHQAGLQGAIAPLGTAMTEDQIMLLWGIIPAADKEEGKVPVLCFDGDNAGRRAAERACERIIPLLKPNHSVLLAFLPEGEDPDSFLKSRGKQAFVDQLKNAQALSDFIWDMTLGAHDYSTPESRAGLEKRLYQVAGRIQDESVQHHYRSVFKSKLWEYFRRSSQNSAQSFSRGKSGKNLERRIPLSRPALSKENNAQDMNLSIALATLINHPFLIQEMLERLEPLMPLESKMLGISDSMLEWSHEKEGFSENSLDSEALKYHLNQAGLESLLENLLHARVYAHASFAQVSASEEKARQGLNEMIGRIESAQLENDLKVAQQELRETFSPESEARVMEVRRLLEERQRILSGDQVA